MLSWVNNAVNSVSVEVQRDSGAGFVQVKQTYLDDTWTDLDVTLPTAITYRIRAINPFGASAWSAERVTGLAFIFWQSSNSQYLATI